MPQDDNRPHADLPAPLEHAEIEVVDVSTLDVDATVEEVMTAVHWIEDHTPGLGTDHQSDPAPVSADPVKPTRRRLRAIGALTN